MVRTSWKQKKLRKSGKDTQKYTKGLNDLDNQDYVITHLEPDVPDGEIKWALGGITISKASGGDGIPSELLKIIKYNAVKVLRSALNRSVNLENLAVAEFFQWLQDWKESVFIPISKKGNGKEYSNYYIIALISHASKVML